MAGPLYQGALELREEDIDREAIEVSRAQVLNTTLRMIRDGHVPERVPDH